MKKIDVTGWVAMTARGNVSKRHVREHPEMKSGFPIVYREASMVPFPLNAVQVRVTVELAK